MTQDNRVAWARLISDILSPPIIWAVVAFPIASSAAESTAQALLWGAVYAVIVCLLPALYIVYGVWRGTISDLHVTVREQRFRPFLFSLTCTLIAWTALQMLGAPSLLPLFALFSFFQILIMFLITLQWQISMHAMSITGAVVIAGAIYGVGAALLVSPLIPIVGAARIKLKSHTPAQVIAGATVGGILTFGMFLISRNL